LSVIQASERWKGWAGAIPPARDCAPQTIRRRSNRIAIKACPPAGRMPVDKSAIIKFPLLQSPFVNGGDELFSR
jgi:hypothetical protein